VTVLLAIIGDSTNSADLKRSWGNSCLGYNRRAVGFKANEAKNNEVRSPNRNEQNKAAQGDTCSERCG